MISTGFGGPVQNIQLLPSAARTAVTSSDTINNDCYRGLVLYLNITVSGGTGGLTPILTATDPVSGVTSNVATIGTAKISDGMYVYTIYPAASLNASSGGVLASPLPANFAIKISPGDGSSYTYSLSADLIP